MLAPPTCRREDGGRGTGTNRFSVHGALPQPHQRPRGDPRHTCHHCLHLLLQAQEEGEFSLLYISYVRQR
jgi:hypothetical protein